MKLRHLTYLAFILCIGTTFAQQRIKNIHVEIEYYLDEERPVKLLNVADDPYQVNLLSGAFRDLGLQFNFRMEDELTSEDTYTLFSEVSFFDLRLNYQIGKVGISWVLENLINYNSTSFAIEGSQEREYGVIDTVIFAHEADFMMSTALTYNF